MSKKPIGVAILTNGTRQKDLARCITSFLVNCHYRPLVIGVYDNGSTDDTWQWLSEAPPMYGVTIRTKRAEKDLGCAVGTNESIQMVSDCEYVIHLESDFEHIQPELSGEDKLWLHRAVDFMDTHICDYLYLRRMVDERDIFNHWWSQWMEKIDKTINLGVYLRCPGFWWSNNPTLFRTKALYDCGTLPLVVAKDGAKGTPGWSKPELEAPRPPNTWIHKWGLFIHEKPLCENNLVLKGCGFIGDCNRLYKNPFTCKYGFFKDGTDAFCKCCDRGRDIRDMDAHARRFINSRGA